MVVGDRKMAVFNDVEPKDKLLLYPHRIEWKNHVPVPDKKEAEKIPARKEGAAERGMPPLPGVCRPEDEAADRRRGGHPGPEGAAGLPAVHGKGRKVVDLKTDPAKTVRTEPSSMKRPWWIQGAKSARGRRSGTSPT